MNTELSDWKASRTSRRAGVTSLGVGGTNAHAVLEEAPARAGSGPSRPWTLLTLSAKTDTALEAITIDLGDHLKQSANQNLADVAYTLQMGRVAFAHRRMLISRSCQEAAEALQMRDNRRLSTGVCQSIRPDVVFMFSGQGSQYLNLAAELYQTELGFKEEIDRCSELLRPHMTADLRELLYCDERRNAGAADALNQTSAAQPALFAVEYALARLWMAWGVHPSAMAGHSIGEYVAACLAGVFSLEEALTLVALRGKLMQSMPHGAMIAVSLSEKEICPLLDGKLSLAAINGPSLCVVSGEEEAIARLESSLSGEQVSTQRLVTSHAFHSRMMEPILPAFTERVAEMARKPPKLPFLSNVTGTWISPQQATDRDTGLRISVTPSASRTAWKSSLRSRRESSLRSARGAPSAPWPGGIHSDAMAI